LLDQEVHADVVEDAKVALALIRARDGQSPALEETASAKPPALLQQTAWRRNLPRMSDADTMCELLSAIAEDTSARTIADYFASIVRRVVDRYLCRPALLRCQWTYLQR